MATYDQAPRAVRQSISEASRLTGESEQLMAKIAGRESGFNPHAANPKSTAKGLGQFIDSTWEAETKRVGGRYGITAATSRFDARASAIMMAEHAKENRRVLKHTLGRAATDGEVYVAHFMGAGGATGMIRNAEKNPTALAADIYPKEAAANKTIFFNSDGSKRSMREVYSGLTATADDTGVTPPLGSGALPSIYSAEEHAPEAIPFTERLKSGFFAAVEQEQTQAMAAQYLMRTGDEALAPDKNFRWTPETIKSVTADLPEDMATWVVENAHSEAHATDLVKRARHEMENEAELADFGLMGNLGLRGAAILTDVPTWLLGAGAGKIASFAKLGRLATAGRAGLIAAAEALPGELMKHEQRANYGMDDVLLGTTGAMAFGAGFGAIFGKSGKELDDVFAKEDAGAFRDVLDADGTKLTPDGEAILAASAGPRMATSGGSAASPVPTPLKRGILNIDLYGKLASRANLELRDLMPKLFTDVVGDGGKTVRGGGVESAWDYKVRTDQSIKAETFRVTNDAFKEWADDQGMSGVQRLSARKSFNEEVGRLLPLASDPPEGPLGKAVKAHQDAYARVLKEAKAAGAKWAEEVDPNARYFPMVFDKNRIRELVSRYDEDGVASVISQAMRSANGKLTTELADKAAQKYLRTITSVTEGTNGNMAHIINGQDREALKDLLVEQGLSVDEAATLVEVLKPSRKTGPANFRQKTLMSDTVKFVPEGGSRAVTKADAFSVRDLTNMDADEVMEKYVGQMSGQIAMVRAGFQNAGAYDAHISEITLGRQNSAVTRNAAGKAVNHYDETTATADLESLRYLGKTIYGVPTHKLDPNVARMISIFGNWNFTRMMGQSGVAQLGDAPKIILKTSLSAGIRTFRLSEIVDVFKKGGTAATELGRELETMTGMGTIGVRGKIINHYEDIDEFVPQSQANVALDRAAKLTKSGANLTAMVSGMVPATDYLGRWAVRASMQHLADVVRGVKNIPTNVLNDMGLGPEDLVRFKALVDQMEIRPNGVVGKLNLEKLQKLDPEGVDKMGAWLSRTGRTIVLEPNPAMLPQFMGHPMARLLMQFRTFSMASHAANTMHNIKMGPAYAAQSLMITSVWGGLIYAGHTYTKSIGQPDQEKYLEDRLNPVTWAASAFSRSADAGLLPLFLDTAAAPVYGMLDIDSPFSNARTTGLAAGIKGAPTVSLIEDLMMIPTEALSDAAREDKQFTRRDMGRFNRLVPLNNTFVVANAFAAISGLFPETETGQ
ncbi:transglycosylase SLT domain-containing protein [Phenylobacterium sp.]|uniref:transglycosylase SLT domain-containing protein n=1 Tax=Phenylobacterium sp. TaxID=1871053 RepID=UPI002737C9BD|nr:transglycosylase SLT domain-containing protein [Phenylobacterium sp.]MDP3869932.1 transglycosylase SLT domain-containing protein [Phenylobacterium sp.]